SLFSTLTSPPRSPLFPYTTLFRSNLFSTAMAADAFTQHVKSFSHAGCVSEEEFENSLFCLRCCLFQPLLRGFRHSLLSSARSYRSEEHTSELQSRFDLVCRLLLEK